jgi:hypothetical protein
VSYPFVPNGHFLVGRELEDAEGGLIYFTAVGFRLIAAAVTSHRIWVRGVDLIETAHKQSGGCSLLTVLQCHHMSTHRAQDIRHRVQARPPAAGKPQQVSTS